MRLSLLLGPGLTVAGAAGRRSRSPALSADSREVRPGTLFVAVAGSRADGRTFIDDAVARGAAAVLSDPSLAGRTLPVPLILDENPRRRLALLAARLVRAPARVRGRGHRHQRQDLGRRLHPPDLDRPRASPRARSAPSASKRPGVQRPGNLTTPDPVRLHALLAEVAAAGVDHLVLEASSHGLDQHRLDGVRLSAAAFTNLSRDHFDYHESFADYLAAKRRLFSELLPPEGIAVLNADQPEYAPLAELCRGRGIGVLDYGRRAERLRLDAQVPDHLGQDLRFTLDGRAHRVRLGLVGDFQAMNVLAALGLVVACGADPAAAVGTLEGLRGVRGRLERIAGHPKGAEVFVDYAHTPDALAQALDRAAAARPRAPGRAVRLRRRSRSGQAARDGAHGGRARRPRGRDRRQSAQRGAGARSASAILAACPEALEIGDRREAIRTALASLEAGDVLLVAGKGHESGQIVGDRVLPFDDAAEVRAALAALGGVAA